MKKLLFPIITLALLTACKGGNQQQTADNNDEQEIEYAYRDSTIYGFCGEGSAMNTLQLITDTGDTINVSVTRARDMDKVFGGYAVGVTSLAGLYFNLFHPLIQTYIFIILSLTFIREATE